MPDVQKSCVFTHMVNLVPRLLCGGGGKRVCYTLFKHAPSSLGNLHTMYSTILKLPQKFITIINS